MRNALQNEIAKVHQLLGITIFLVSHDLNEVLKLANHVISLENGLVKQTGTPEEVFFRHQNQWKSADIQSGSSNRKARHNKYNYCNFRRNENY
jgi:osmoprotectant transport system ATP-binding protein